MDFPYPAYFRLFVHSSTENQLNILFVCIVADDNINYLPKFIMLNSKEDWILIHNFHVLKSCSTIEFSEKDGVCAVLNYLLKNCEKPAQQTDRWAAAHLAHHILLRTLIEPVIWHLVSK